MAKYEIPISYNLPDNIEIDLIRSDFFDVGNIFRISFEISLAVFSGILGYFLTVKNLDFIEYLLIGLLILIIGASLYYYQKFNKKSRLHEVNSEIEKEDFWSTRKFHLYLNIKLDQQTQVNERLKLFKQI